MQKVESLIKMRITTISANVENAHEHVLYMCVGRNDQAHCTFHVRQHLSCTLFEGLQNSPQ